MSSRVGHSPDEPSRPPAASSQLLSLQSSALQSSSSQLSSLQSASGVREASKRVFDYVAQGQSAHFTLDVSRLPHVVDVVAEVTLEQYPDLDAIPFHSRLGHFDAGGIGRLAALERRLEPPASETRVPPAQTSGEPQFYGAPQFNGEPQFHGSPQASPALQLQAGNAEVKRSCLADLIVTSVLLDAGAGPSWRYTEPTSHRSFGRSEGLAVASYWWFLGGGFSSQPEAAPLRADAVGLQAVTEAGLCAAFQVGESNPLVGVPGRVALLQRLGAELATNPWFASRPTRGGAGGEDGFRRRPSDVLRGVPLVDGRARADDVLNAVLHGFGGVWPGRETLNGVNLGDVWTHSQLGHVPFHKLSQWLSYSLCDALQRTGIEVTALDELTGLAEYRNGGLFLDLGVIAPRTPELLEVAHQVSSDVVIEWRALTVALLDLTAAALRERWGKTAEQLPLVKVLEGGTWRAGRKLAAERRSDAGPPLTIVSDGTVF